MRKTFSTVFWLIPALPLMLFEALLHLPLLLRRLRDKWRYTALTLREPPPPGGMFGAVARRLKEKTINCEVKK
jgi:hypothetical protein